MILTGTLSHTYIHIGLGRTTCPHHPAASVVPGIVAGPAATRCSGTGVLSLGPGLVPAGRLGAVAHARKRRGRLLLYE